MQTTYRLVAMALLAAIAATMIPPVTADNADLNGELTVDKQTCLQGQMACWCVDNGCEDELTGYDCYAHVGIYYDHPIGFLCTPSDLDLDGLLAALLASSTSTASASRDVDLGLGSTETCLQGALVCWCIDNGCYDYATGFDCYASVGLTAGLPIGFICTPTLLGLGTPVFLATATGDLAVDPNLAIGSTETCLQGALVCWCINNHCYDYVTGFPCVASVGVTAGMPIGFICTPTILLGQLMAAQGVSAVSLGGVADVVALSSTETCLQGQLVCWCINNHCYDYATGFDCYASVGVVANFPIGFVCTPSLAILDLPADSQSSQSAAEELPAAGEVEQVVELLPVDLP